MEIDKIIELKNDNRYGLLLKSELDLEGYYLAVQVDDNDQPTKNYAVLQEVKKDGKTFVKKISNPIILNKLLEDYNSQYEEMFE